MIRVHSVLTRMNDSTHSNYPYLSYGKMKGPFPLVLKCDQGVSQEDHGAYSTEIKC